MKLAIGADPGGFGLIGDLKKHLVEQGHDVADLGTTDPDNPVMYMDVARNVAEAVTSDAAELGIVVCGTGVGISIAANKNKGARCARVESVWAARDSRIVNDANILALGGTTISLRMACEMADVFIQTKWGEGLPEFRVKRIKDGAAMWDGYEGAVFK